MRFGILTQYYPPELGAPQARLSDLAQRLAERGHEVIVLTAMPSYPQGKIYPGYGGVTRSETMQGVRVVRTAIYPTQKINLLPRLTNYFSFVLSSWLVGGWSLPRLDYLLTESPPLFLGMAGYVLSRWKRARWIFNVSDLWPESAVRLGLLKDGLSLRLSQALEAFCYRKAWLVTGQSRSILDDIQGRFPGVRTYHFSNGVDTTVFQQDGKGGERLAAVSGDGEIVALYAGLHGVAQGLDQVLLAAARLEDLPRFRISFVGDGPDKKRLQNMAEELGLTNVRFLDPVPKEAMPALVSQADICLAPLKIYIPGAVPSKLYEAMACGRPVVFVGEGEAAQIVIASQAGLVIRPGDVSGLAASLRELAVDGELRRHLGACGRRVAETQFDREIIFRKFEIQLLEE